MLSSTFCPTLEDANVDNLLKFESEKGENFLDFIETFDEVKKGVLEEKRKHSEKEEFMIENIKVMKKRRNLIEKKIEKPVPLNNFIENN